ncbi:SDR family NAD(P)-dependent oxidoreductase [Streptosporangium sp. KLBMP 9127]|nr:SDR family NAD(P)-dependent oxidoreductase [Streptosporangium sp. KLBMP 9127]
MVIARHGRIDILVNNAGRSHVGAEDETGEAEQRALFEVHFFGPAALLRPPSTEVAAGRRHCARSRLRA